MSSYCLGIDGAGNLRQAADGRVLARRCDGLLRRGLVDVGEAHPLHGVEVIKIAPIFLEPVRGRQGLGVISEMVLAELACGVAKIVQELGECRCTCPQVGRASGDFRQGHADAQRVHAGEEGSTPSRAALLGVISHEDRAFIADAIDVRRFADREAPVIDARLHPADVITHDEEDVRLLLRRSRCRHLLLRDHRSSRYNRCQAEAEKRRHEGNCASMTAPGL